MDPNVGRSGRPAALLGALAVACAGCGTSDRGSPADGRDSGDAHPADSSSEGSDVADAPVQVADAPAEAPTPMEAGDAEPDAPPAGCNPAADFGTPVLVAGLESDTERGGPRLTADELTIYFSGRPGDVSTPSGLYVAQRPSLSAPFGTPVPLAALNGSFNDFDPTTLDQITLYFSSNSADPGSDSKDIFISSRASVVSVFGPPMDLASPVNTTADDAQPFLRADGMELWFSSDRANPSFYDIYRAPIARGVVGTPQIVSEISSGTATDWCPTLSADGLSLFFSSDRTPGSPGSRLIHIWTASRSRAIDPFSNPRLVTAVNSQYADFSGWLSPDGCRLYMSSRRPPLSDAGVQVERIYVATRGW